VPILLALLAALGFGTGDFLAGLASRRIDFRVVSTIAQSLGLLAAVVAVLVFAGGNGLTGHVLLWGAIAGVGNGVGAMFLYHGLSIGRMSIVATLAGLMGSVVPVVFGVIQGDTLSAISAIGIVFAIPAIALVSWQPAAEEGTSEGSGAIGGFLAGLCFALFFIALDQAGNDSGAWPVAVNQAMAVLIAGSLALPVVLAQGIRLPRPDLGLVLGAGVALGLATIFLQTAFESGELAIVVVLTSLYPGVTILLARFSLAEHWIKTQKIGLAAALAAVVLVSAGSS
jgi:drug/metabolite transporter (DMT)-like permease